MGYLKLALIVLNLLQRWMKKLEHDGVFKQGEASVILRNLEAANAELKKVIEIRARVRDIISANPERVREPDKFERQDDPPEAGGPSNG